MKIRFWSFLVLVIALSSCSTYAPIEIELYTSLKVEFKNSDVDLEKKLAEYETMLLDRKVLKNTSWKARKSYLEFAAKNDTFPQVKIDSGFIEFVTLQNQLSLKALENTIYKFDKYHKEEFDKSKFKAILNQVDAAPIETRNRPKTIAKAVLDNLTDADYKDPFYKALVLMVIANSNDVYMQSLDSALDFSKLPPNHEAFYQFKGCGVITRHLDIITNNNHELLIQGLPYKHLDSISDKVVQFYSMKRNSTDFNDRQFNASELSYYRSFPLYSIEYLNTVTAFLSKSQEVFLSCLNNPNASKDLTTFRNTQRYTALNKLRLVLIHNKKYINEISPNTYLSIELEITSGSAMNKKIWHEIYSAYYELRKDECQTVFKQSYQKLKTRSNFFYNDILKLRLIETLFPIKIILNFKSAFPPPEPVKKAFIP